MPSLNPNSLLYKILEEVTSRDTWMKRESGPKVPLSSIPGAVSICKIEDSELQALYLISLRYTAQAAAKSFVGVSSTWDGAIGSIAKDLFYTELSLLHKLPEGVLGVADGWQLFYIDRAFTAPVKMDGMLN